MKINETLSSMISEPRQKGKIKHPLQNIMIITISAVICGADNWENIADFGIRKKEWLKKFLNLPDNNTPSADTIARLFHVIKADEFERFLGEKSKELQERLEEAQDVMKRLKDR